MTSQAIQSDKLSHIGLDISSTSEQIECQKYNRCGKSNCITCATIYQSQKSKETAYNIKHKDLYRLVLTIRSTPEFP